MINLWKTKIITLLLILLSIITFAQSTITDSLNNELKSSSKIKHSRIFNMLAYEWMDYNMDSSYHYAQLALINANKHNQQKEKAQALFSCGFYHELNEDLFNALESYNKSFKIYKLIDDKNGMASLASFIGTIYKFTGDYDLASKYFYQSIDLYFQIQDLEGIAYAYNNLGIIYFKTEANIHAKDAFLKSLKYSNLLHDTLSLSSTYNNLGLLALRLKEYDKALTLFKTSLHLSQLINDKAGMATVYSNIADIYIYKNEYEVALNYLSLVDINNTPEFFSPRTSNNYLNLAQIYYKTQKLELAEKNFLKAIESAESKNLKPQLADIYYEYSVFLSDINRIADANKYLFKLIQIKDTLYKEQIQSQIANTNFRIKLAEQNFENTTLEQKNKLSTHKIKQWEKTGFILIGTSIIILILLLLINSRASKLKKQKKVLEVKHEETEKLNRELSELHESLSKNIIHKTIELKSECEKRFEAEKNLQKIHYELKNLHELKNQFIININGEIRSSLNVIIGYSKLLQGSQDKDIQTYASYINNNAKHLFMSLQNTLAFELAENKKIILNKTTFSFSSLLDKSSNYIKALLPNILLKGNTNINSDILINTDKDLLFKLINDSIKFLNHLSEKETINIECEENKDSTNCYIKTKCSSDQLNTLTKIIQFNTDIDLQTLSKEDASVYSSLFYIQSLIKALNTDVQIHINAPYIEIIFKLPIEQKAIVDIKHKTKKSSPLRFAIVESDDKISTLLIQKKLEKKGEATLLSGISPENTLELEKAKNYDFIFLDIPSRQINKWSLAINKITKSQSLAPIIAVSAYLTPEDKKKLLSSGFSFYLNKPLNSDYLFNIIDSKKINSSEKK